MIFALDSHSAAQLIWRQDRCQATREASRQSKLDFLFVFSVATAKG